MTEQEKELVIEYYDKEVWVYPMKPSSELTEKEIKIWHNTFGFATWNLAYHFDKCVEPIRQILDKMINKLK